MRTKAHLGYSCEIKQGKTMSASKLDEIDRKILADLAVNDRDAFGRLAEQAKAALGR